MDKINSTRELEQYVGPQNAMNTSQGYWLGRIYSTSQTSLPFLFQTVIQVVKEIFLILNRICADPNLLSSIFRKLDLHVLMFLEYLMESPGRLKKLQKIINSSYVCINALQIAADIDYFANVRFKTDTTLFIAGKMTKCLADIGESILWIAQLGFVSLAKLSITFGNIPLIKITQTLVEGMWGFSYAAFSMDALELIIEPKNHVQRIYALLECAKNANELILKIFFLAELTNIVALGILGCSCIFLELSSMACKEYAYNT